MSCPHCAKPLHKEQQSYDQTHTSCVKCSKTHGKEHVYYEASKIKTVNHNGKQEQLCPQCRTGRRGPHLNHKLCHQMRQVLI